MPRQKKAKPNRNDGRYEVKITVGTDIHGKPIRKSFYSDVSKADAVRQAEEYKIQSESALRSAAEIIDDDVTFREWAQEWLKTYIQPHVDENTYQFTYENTIRNHLSPALGRLKLINIKPINIQKFYAAKTDYSVSMLKKMHMCLMGIFDTAVDNGILRANPAKHINFSSDAEEHEKHALPDDQIAFLEQFALQENMPEIALLLETGMRRGEMLGLMWSDINLSEGTYSVNRSLADVRGKGVVIRPPKKDSYRTNPLSEAASAILMGVPREGLYLFPNKLGNLQSPNAWSKRMASFMRRACKLRPDIPMVTAHELRHTYGTKLRRDGVDIYTIAKVLGHRDINVTANVYVKEDVKMLREALGIASSKTENSVQVSSKCRQVIPS